MLKAAYKEFSDGRGHDWKTEPGYREKAIMFIHSLPSTDRLINITETQGHYSNDTKATVWYWKDE